MITNIDLTSTSSPFKITGAGHNITARAWGNSLECQASLLLIHGLCTNSQWFEAFARKLKASGVYIVAYDQIGFGDRQNERFSSYQQWLDDLNHVYSELKAQVSGKPIYIIGNSMGALVALSQAQHLKPAGIALLSPGFAGNRSTFNLIYQIKALTLALLLPQCRIKLPYGVEEVARNPAVKTWFVKNNMSHLDVPALMLLELSKLSAKMHTTAQKTTVPVIMLTAGRDTIVDNQVNSQIFDALASSLKAKHEFAQAWHDLIFDPLLDDVLTELRNWMPKCL